MAGLGASVDGYRLVEDLGTDSRGARFRALDDGGAPHVLAFASAETAGAPGFRDGLARSVALSARVSSFSLLTAVDADPWADVPWVAFRHVEHVVPLGERLARGGPLAGRELYRFAVHTATALAVLHDAGIVHHAVTGENVLVGDGGATVVDGVLDRAVEIAADGPRSLLEPRPQTSEPGDGGRTTRADDVFAWAVTAVGAATGRSAFPGSASRHAVTRAVGEEPDLEGVPEPLSSVLGACLTRDPDRRPSARRVLAVLLGYTRDDVRPEPGELHERSRRFGTRKRWMPLEIDPGALEGGFRVPAREGRRPARVSEPEGSGSGGGLNLIWQPPDMEGGDGD
ncbi:protein kinase [Nocardiopsis flavescens]